MNFDNFHHYYYQDTQHCCYPFLSVPLQSAPTPLQIPGNHWSAFHYYKLSVCLLVSREGNYTFFVVTISHSAEYLRDSLRSQLALLCNYSLLNLVAWNILMCSLTLSQGVNRTQWGQSLGVGGPPLERLRVTKCLGTRAAEGGHPILADWQRPQMYL